VRVMTSIQVSFNCETNPTNSVGFIPVNLGTVDSASRKANGCDAFELAPRTCTKPFAQIDSSAYGSSASNDLDRHNRAQELEGHGVSYDTDSTSARTLALDVRVVFRGSDGEGLDDLTTNAIRSVEEGRQVEAERLEKPLTKDAHRLFPPMAQNSEGEIGIDEDVVVPVGESRHRPVVLTRERERCVRPEAIRGVVPVEGTDEFVRSSASAQRRHEFSTEVESQARVTLRTPVDMPDVVGHRVRSSCSNGS